MKLLRALGLVAFTAGALAFSVPSELSAQTPADAKAAAKAARLKAKQDALAKNKAEETKSPQTTTDGKAPEKFVAKPKVVKPQDLPALIKMIDTQIDAKIKAEGIPASSKCTDEEFLRRAYLDITGVIPTYEKAKAFLDDKSADKRVKLVDELLNDPNYGRKNADIWLAKLYPRESTNRFVQKEPLYNWFKDQFNANTTWDELVGKIVGATGTVDKNPEVTYYLANRSVDKLTDTTTQHFMGVRLMCAQCHNHPFTGTKQLEYWGVAAFFSKVSPSRPGNANKGADNSTLGVSEGAQPNKIKDFFPEATKKVPPKFLNGSEPKLTSSEPYRPTFVSWLTAQDNPFFAKAMVNRTWAMMFGNGIVDPIDDLIETNKPSHPELLNQLSEHFASTGFDVKYLIRGIVLSNAYQRSSKPAGNNKTDTELFSHMAVKVMSAEQLFDSTMLVTGGDKAETKKPAAAAGKGQPTGRRDQFVQFFTAGAEEINPNEYDAGIPQALRLINSKTSASPQILKQFAASSSSKPADVIEKMYITTLSRRPTADETQRLTDYISKATTTQEAYGDILWALMNSSEFTMVK